MLAVLIGHDIQCMFYNVYFTIVVKHVDPSQVLYTSSFTHIVHLPLHAQVDAFYG